MTFEDRTNEAMAAVRGAARLRAEVQERESHLQKLASNALRRISVDALAFLESHSVAPTPLYEWKKKRWSDKHIVKEQGHGWVLDPRWGVHVDYNYVTSKLFLTHLGSWSSHGVSSNSDMCGSNPREVITGHEFSIGPFVLKDFTDPLEAPALFSSKENYGWTLWIYDDGVLVMSPRYYEEHMLFEDWVASRLAKLAVNS